MTDRESRDLSKFLERSPRKSGKPEERKQVRKQS